MPGHIRSAAPVTQNHLSKPEDLMLQNATPLRKSAPSPPNISDEHVSCIAFAKENVSLQILFKCPTPAIVFGNATKSAHTALAVKACLLGGNSYTKCSITFVNIAVAISALAGGGAKNGFAPRPDPKNGFAPRPEYGGVFDIFRGFLGVWAQEGIEMEFWVILVAFRQWKNGQKWKKHCT